jgi:hypothetical protein
MRCYVYIYKSGNLMIINQLKTMVVSEKYRVASNVN